MRGEVTEALYLNPHSCVVSRGLPKACCREPVCRLGARPWQVCVTSGPALRHSGAARGQLREPTFPPRVIRAPPPLLLATHWGLTDGDSYLREPKIQSRKEDLLPEAPLSFQLLLSQGSIMSKSRISQATSPGVSCRPGRPWTHHLILVF